MSSDQKGEQIGRGGGSRCETIWRGRGKERVDGRRRVQQRSIHHTQLKVFLEKSE